MRLPSRLVFCALLIAAAQCGGGSGPKKDSGVDAGACGDGGAPRPNGQACGCAGDCQSHFCVDGICCNSACTETCKTCNDQSAPGICSFVPNGAMEQRGACQQMSASTCGLDGTCDGQGNCRRYPAGTVCKAGSCDGDAVSNVNVCDGQGRCRSGPATICAPYACDTAASKCKTSCKANTDCADGVLCVDGSCGAKPNGAACTADAECASQSCADGVCCNVACKTACVSCNQPARVGTCWPIDVGGADPHGICAMQAPSSCGTTGTCDGFGGCALYAAEIVCVPPSCNGDRLNTAGTCNGLGTCRTPGVQDCTPYSCANGACIGKCTGDADCVAGHSCVNGSCGPKSNGQPCTGAAECASTFCVDGVCCADACMGACRSCGLASSLGRCTPVPAGSSDPRQTCVDQTAATCGTDSKCDGAGNCRRYRAGTVCAAAHCENNVFTPESLCSTSGDCVAPTAITCVPYVCNGNQCFGACSADANCAPPNVCNGGSCGKKPNGAFCSAAAECVSGNCAQGVCCASACTGACRSCALAGSMGNCTNVPAGSPDPSQTCVDSNAPSCGTNGKCEAGACQKYALGTACAPATCPGGTTTLTRQSTCDGAGTCITPAATSCFPYSCGAAVCNSTCAADADCAPPATCIGGSCGLKPNGASCGTNGTECLSGICAQGVCCATACTAICSSCALAGSEGTCAPVPAGGVDPKNQCTDQGPASCGTTGVCDGFGACQRYAAGTQCVGPSCPGGTATATLPRTCNGTGVCGPAVTLSCGAYACNGTTCNAACGSNADCSPGNVCNAGSCGKKRLGQTCSAGPECDSGNCVDGVCCSTSSCGTCYSCNVPMFAGLCTPVLNGDMEPHGGCTASPPCGHNGTCDGAGACRFFQNGTSCGQASCTGSTYSPIGHCDGAGTCVSSPQSCNGYVCGGGVCLTTCSGAGDCSSGYNCLSGSCSTLKLDGAPCSSGSECANNICADGVCCHTACMAGCFSCNLPGSVGTCTLTPAGGNDTHGVCAVTAPSSCGTNGKCDGVGGCTLYPANTVCAPNVCSGPNNTKASLCSGTGTCVLGGATSCAPYACNSATGACRTNCSVPTDCANPNQCNGGVCN